VTGAIKDHRGHQNTPHDHALQRRRDVEGVEAVPQGPHDQRTDQGSDHAPFSAHQTDSTDHRSRDRIELVHFARQRRRRIQSRGHQHRRNTRHQSRQAVDGHLVATHRDPGEPRRLLVTADGIGVAAQLGTGQYEVGQQVEGGHHQAHHRYPGAVTRQRTE